MVAAGLADRCEVQLSYAIGVAEPTSVLVDCFGTEKADPEKISAAIREAFPLTPRGIIETLGLRTPIYRVTARHGHFGRPFVEQESAGKKHKFFTWERTDRAEALKTAAR